MRLQTIINGTMAGWGNAKVANNPNTLIFLADQIEKKVFSSSGNGLYPENLADFIEIG